ncbi:MAG: radical SAM family heme chaperone HemW [Bacteroidetes bacterium]|nr:radical SAM family heme chaperone HemW [Bacteroidota bacterium]
MASIYIHIPFCEHKCIYCDFYSVVPAETGTEGYSQRQQYISSLKAEIEILAENKSCNESIGTIFFGGGTPSLLHPSEIEQILDTLAAHFSIEAGAEITLEANPGTVDKNKLADFRTAGINRISIGIQSFHDDDLKFLTRIHSSSEAKKCVKDASEAGFENISFDLIFSLPGQTLSRWKSNLEQAVELQPAHISCYSLSVEPKTPLFYMIQSRQAAQVEMERDADLYEFTIDFLSSHGYEQYEVSNFARRDPASDFKCRHNLNYWNHSNYLGFGPSAHSFWINERWWNISNLSEYIKKINIRTLPVSEREKLTAAQLMEEAIFLGLRSEGIDLNGFRRKFSRDLSAENERVISELIKQDKIILVNGRMRLTAKGYVICDEICQKLH